MKRSIEMLAVASGLLLSASLANAQTFVRMVSGPAGGSWYPLGAKIMQVMQQEVGGIATSWNAAMTCTSCWMNSPPAASNWNSA